MDEFWNFSDIKNEVGETTGGKLEINGEIMDSSRAWIYEWLNISHTSPNSFKKALNNYKGKDIELWIDSPGGSVFAGASIYNALKEHDGNITAKINKAMSAASVIAMAADTISMSPVGIMMIHNPLSRVAGDMHDMRKMADVLDTVKDTIINAYVLKTGKNREEISQMMNDETFMSANVAVKQNFADDVLFTDGVENVEMSFSHVNITNSANISVDDFFKIYQKNKLESQNIKKLEIARAKLKLELIL